MEGRDPMEHIVNLSYDSRNNFITVFYRNDEDQKCKKREPFKPFVWATLDACLKLCDGNRTALKRLMQQYGIGVKKLRNTDLDGNVVHEFDDGYMFMFYAKEAMPYHRFLNFFKTAKNPIFSDNKDGNGRSNRQYLAVTPQEQFLISTGKRFFKGYNDYDELLRMTFDLESEGLDTEKDRITHIGIRMNRPFRGHPNGFEKVIDIVGDTKDELDKCELWAIDQMFKIIYTFQPDVITAHNGENFDWNLIFGACKRLGYTIEDVTEKYFGGESVYKEARESILKLGGEIETFHRTVVPNIIVTDSLHAVRRAQATDSNFLKADLKYSTEYLELKKKNRVYIPGDKINETLNDKEHDYAFCDEDGDWYKIDPNTKSTGGEFKKGRIGDEKFKIYTRDYIADNYTKVSGDYIVERYLLDDIYECDRVEYSLNGADFMLTKFLPLSFSKACTMGTAGQWKALMLAWSYENNLAIPKAEDTGAFTGGLSRLLKTGFVKNVIKLDYNSLYPSIILTWGIMDNTDLLAAMLGFLEYVLTSREVHKEMKKKADKIVTNFERLINAGKKVLGEDMDEYKHQQSVFKVEDNNQLVFKKLGNSFFGAYGSNSGAVFPWKSVKCAEQTTCTGRQCLRLMISHFNELGYEPIVGDTDGFNFKLPDSFRYKEENPYIGKGLNREVKEGKEYTGFEADVAEFNDTYMRDFHYSPLSINKMGLGIDEIVSSTINFSRKNYADYFPEKPFPKDVKLVGNTIKSKKMPTYISNFLTVGIRQLLRGEGQEFLNYYYDYVEKIYNYKIPLRDIASKGKIKKTLNEYKKDCQTLTKSGNAKSRQAWYELCLKEGINPDVGDTIYYINTGSKKTDNDIKKVTRWFDITTGEKIDVTKDIEKDLRKFKKEHPDYPNDKSLESLYFEEHRDKKYVKEYEVVFSCQLLPRDIVEAEDDIYCEEGVEYNVAKYIDMFNKRITPLLVCFSKDIRNNILINDPKDRPYFTEDECILVSGQPNKVSDQDTYEQLMTMDDKEIRFWMKYDLVPPFIEECKMGKWEDIKEDYLRRKKEEEENGIAEERRLYNEALQKLTKEDINKLIDEGEIPVSILTIVEVNPVSSQLISKKFENVVIGNISDLIDVAESFKFKNLGELL